MKSRHLHADIVKAVFLGMVLCGALVGAAPPSDDDLGKIAVYAGTWNTSIEHFATKYSKARVDSASVTNACWRSNDYYACNQIVGGKSAALIVYTYDTAGKVYHTHAVPKDGSPAQGGELRIVGNTWTYPWKDHDGSKTVYIRILNTFRDPATIDFRQEVSLDNAHWTLTAQGVEHKV
ncbi:MAG: hypothetical protein NVSMB31_09590 [Vulcanimicrobiaceae bacterium]